MIQGDDEGMEDHAVDCLAEGPGRQEDEGRGDQHELVEWSISVLAQPDLDLGKGNPLAANGSGEKEGCPR
jgi:hypothetical protein